MRDDVRKALNFMFIRPGHAALLEIRVRFATETKLPEKAPNSG